MVLKVNFRTSQCFLLLLLSLKPDHGLKMKKKSLLSFFMDIDYASIKQNWIFISCKNAKVKNQAHLPTKYIPLFHFLHRHISRHIWLCCLISGTWQECFPLVRHQNKNNFPWCLGQIWDPNHPRKIHSRQQLQNLRIRLYLLLNFKIKFVR